MNAEVVHVKMVVIALMVSIHIHAAVRQAGKEQNVKSVSKNSYFLYKQALSRGFEIENDTLSVW